VHPNPLEGVVWRFKAEEVKEETIWDLRQGFLRPWRKSLEVRTRDIVSNPKRKRIK
jgi:hypothetical protein